MLVSFLLLFVFLFCLFRHYAYLRKYLYKYFLEGFDLAGEQDYPYNPSGQGKLSKPMLAMPCDGSWYFV